MLSIARGDQAAAGNAEGEYKINESLHKIWYKKNKA